MCCISQHCDSAHRQLLDDTVVEYYKGTANTLDASCLHDMLELFIENPNPLEHVVVLFLLRCSPNPVVLSRRVVVFDEHKIVIRPGVTTFG